MSDAQAQMTDDEFNGHLSVVIESLEDEVEEAPRQNVWPRALVISTKAADGSRTASYTEIKQYDNLDELHMHLAAIGYAFAATGQTACALFVILEAEAEVHSHQRDIARINAVSILGSTIDGRRNMAILKVERTDEIIAALKREAIFKSPSGNVSVDGADPAASFWVEYIKKHLALSGETRSDA